MDHSTIARCEHGRPLTRACWRCAVATVDPDNAPPLLDLDFREELAEARRRLDQAEHALEDEHEGTFKRALSLLADVAERMDNAADRM